MTFYVYSTLTADNAYAVYAHNPNQDLPVIERSILVKGGNGVATKHLVTPRGVVTEISDDDMELLEKDYHFQEHKRLGFITVEKKEIPVEKAIKNMAPKDKSAPKTPADYKKGDAPGTLKTTADTKSKN